MVLLRKEEYPEIEPGEYVAQLIEIKETVSKRNPQFGPSVRFAFRILEHPFVNAIVSGLASAKLLAGNKLDKWLTGLGYEIEIGGDLDTDKLVGRKVRIVVDRDEGSKYTNVKSVYAWRAGKDDTRIDAKAKLLDATSAPASVQAPINVASTITGPTSVAVTNVTPSAPIVQAPQPSAPVTPTAPRNIPF
jgi:hypothetical protein